MNKYRFDRLAPCLFAFVSATALAEPVDFVRDIRPILQQHCYRCHGAEKQQSGLRLDIKSEAFKGGDAYGPAIVGSNVADSPLIELVTSDDDDLRMPLSGKPLSPQQIAVLSRWVQQGATWPDGVDLAVLEDRRDHWSFRPLTDPATPPVNNQAWPRNEIDRFILARLEQQTLRPSPSADRRTWLRRVYFDLIGLPPTPQQLQSFLHDCSPDAYQRVVDQLLASPRYGERWAQHWLDVVRYADTDGFEVNTPRPNAWPYRDYVIEAFNNDTPYDRFIHEQLAGDALQQDAATGFLVTAAALLPGQIGQDDPSKRLARQDALAEILINTGEAFLGLSIGCARCHDHKFDPISQRDYYSMQAFFSGVQYGERPIQSPQAEARRKQVKFYQQRLAELDQLLASYEPLAQVGQDLNPDQRRAAINPQRNVDRFSAVNTSVLRFTINKTNNREPCIDELEVFDSDGQNVALASLGTTVTSSGNAPVSDQHKLQHINDGQYGNGRSWISNQQGQGWIELKFDRPRSIERVVWGRDREGKFKDRLPLEYLIEVVGSENNRQIVASSHDRQPFSDSDQQRPTFSAIGLTEKQARQAKRLFDQQQSIKQQISLATQEQQVFAGSFTTPAATHLLTRGDPEQPREELGPAVIAALGKLELPTDAAEQQRRRSLADWIADPANPLTARVMVNRIWQWHFGTGLVETASDFGRSGARPTHPALLNRLAIEFISSGWSIKSMHRKIVLSATYRQSSQIDLEAQSRDADVRLLWRFPARRLEAEAIRDSTLAVSGQLNLKTGGPGFDLFKSRGGLNGFPPIESFGDDGLRRLIYAHKIRMEREIVFGAFDCPDAGQSMPRRRQSTTPIQALNLFHSQFSFDQAAALAARVCAETGEDPSAQIRRAYLLALGRVPDQDEVKRAKQVCDEHGLATVCRAILNSNEFLLIP